VVAVSFALVGSLMIFTTAHDLLRLFVHS
jgi:hypothetical protein